MRGLDGEVRAFHNICRHRGNKLVWQDFPRQETSGSCRQFVCKYHGWRYDLDGGCNFVQQESEFFDLDKADYGLVPVHCDVWAGFIFVNLDREPRQSLRDFLGPMITAMDDYPFHLMTERFSYTTEIYSNWKIFSTRSRSSTTRRSCTRSNRCRRRAPIRPRSSTARTTRSTVRTVS